MCLFEVVAWRRWRDLSAFILHASLFAESVTRILCIDEVSYAVMTVITPKSACTEYFG